MARKSKDKTNKSDKGDVTVVEVTVEQLEQLAERIERKELLDDDYELMLQILQSYDYVTALLKDDQVKLKRLKRLIFGAKTESSENVLSDQKKEPDPQDKGEGDESQSPPEDKQPPPGHGRNGADQYTGAKQEFVDDETLKEGDTCPQCGAGTLYEIEPNVVVRVSGQPPVAATVYRLARHRCKTCGHVFHAPVPAEAQGEKYDESAAAMIALMKYGSGMPFNRLERLEGNLGIPLPASTQWQVVAAHVPPLSLIRESLLNQVADWKLFHNDDTGVKILESAGLTPPPVDPDKKTKQRTGTFTSIVMARSEDRDAALFFSGRCHAGENLAEVLRHRASDLETPLQMCDALSRNLPLHIKTLLANCLTHARRNFVDVVDIFPEEVRVVVETLATVYKVDDEAKNRKLSPEKRLKLHRAKSQQGMDRLHRWLNRQFDDRLVEPNSSVGSAIKYMLKHWQKLTLFLRVPGAPLDNNIAERALKRAIMHRKNSLFYKTAYGAFVGDLYMSLIHTCELNKVNPYEYLVAAMQNADDVERDPSAWLPWNYHERLASLEEAVDSPLPASATAE